MFTGLSAKVWMSRRLCCRDFCSVILWRVQTCPFFPTTSKSSVNQCAGKTELLSIKQPFLVALFKSSIFTVVFEQTNWFIESCGLWNYCIKFSKWLIFRSVLHASMTCIFLSRLNNYFWIFIMLEIWSGGLIFTSMNILFSFKKENYPVPFCF